MRSIFFRSSLIGQRYERFFFSSLKPIRQTESLSHNIFFQYASRKRSKKDSKLANLSIKQTDFPIQNTSWAHTPLFKVLFTHILCFSCRRMRQFLSDYSFKNWRCCVNRADIFHYVVPVTLFPLNSSHYRRGRGAISIGGLRASVGTTIFPTTFFFFFVVIVWRPWIGWAALPV